jgi:hypothetical protein
MVLHRPVEPAAVIGQVDSRRILIKCDAEKCRESEKIAREK